MLENNIEIIEKKGVKLISKKGKILQYKPWLGDIFSGIYDVLMRKQIFPKLFGSSYEKHDSILKKIYLPLHNMQILELGTGNGNLAEQLSNDNDYTGIDISKGMLKKALDSFHKANFINSEFYVCSADNLPFSENSFDVCICNLSLNFFPNIDQVLKKLQTILKPQGIFYCSVPIAERKKTDKKISGNLFTQQSLKKIMEKYNFEFIPVSESNGALLYFSSKNKKYIN